MEEDMNNDLQFVFNIIDEFKSFYETPIIYLTKKDYGEDIFNVYRDLRSAQLHNNSKENVMNIIVSFHLQWLQVIDDINNYEKQIKNISCEEISQTISYTVNVNKQRVRDLKIFLANIKLVGKYEQELDTNLEILDLMNKEIVSQLLEIEKCFSNFADNREFIFKLNTAADDLLNWIDKLYDHIAVQCSDYFKMNILHELITPLNDIVGQLKIEQKMDSQDIADSISDNKIKEMLHFPISFTLQRRIIYDIINVVEKKIQEFENQNPTGASPFVNKKNYLETKLKCLNNSKLMQIIKNTKHNELTMDDNCVCLEVRIFNHLLPLLQRERLITDLCSIWDRAFDIQRRLKSTISILSATSEKLKYNDDLGEFYVDDYGRKIYEQESQLFQQNDDNKLVPLNDVENRIFFYDECGRYFIDKNTNERVYKANETASEYIMRPSGSLLKVKEVCDNVTFYYDSYGRYYINDTGKHIYRDCDSNSEYEQDGFGNLVRIRSQIDFFDICPGDPHITDDSKYLKQTVGRALCESIAYILIDQPNDPIKYLSALLRRFRANQETRLWRSKDREELLLERKVKAAECIPDETMDLMVDGVSECSYYDSNLLNYNTIDLQYDDSTSSK